MARWTNGGTFLALGTALALSAAMTMPSASAAPRHSGSRHGHSRFAHHRSYAGLQCVPYARSASGIEIGGNAWTWWEQASGQYERGARPEPGSVLAFRSNGRMRLGHVAVVTDVLDAREIAIDHANWSGHGGINRQMRVVDVSDGNDWTAVRLELANGDFGSIYPTHGFIYDRPDHGTMVAAGAAAPAPDLNPAPADLRGRERLGDDGVEEVAEVPEPGRRAHRRYAAHRHGYSHRGHAQHLAFR